MAAIVNITSFGNRFNAAEVMKQLSSTGHDLRARGPEKPAVDEFSYPPRVQEALDFIERETKAYNRREIEAACNHRGVREIPEGTVELPWQVVYLCDWCGKSSYSSFPVPDLRMLPEWRR
jgi:hypothetical protein